LPSKKKERAMKVILVGPEKSGKSLISNALADLLPNAPLMQNVYRPTIGVRCVLSRPALCGNLVLRKLNAVAYRLTLCPFASQDSQH
jgi:hypothetical protein